MSETEALYILAYGFIIWFIWVWMKNNFPPDEHVWRKDK